MCFRRCLFVVLRECPYKSCWVEVMMKKTRESGASLCIRGDLDRSHRENCYGSRAVVTLEVKSLACNDRSLI